MLSILPSLLVRNVFTLLLRHVLLGPCSYVLTCTVYYLTASFSTREHVATTYCDLLTASFFLPVVHLLLLSPSGIDMKLYISDRNLDEILNVFAKCNISAPIELRFNFKRLSNDEKKLLVAKVAKMLNISPEAVKLMNKFKIVRGLVFICEDSTCDKTKPRPLCTIEGFAMLKAWLEL